jgi:predicted nucleic acid-binding protein
MIVVDASAVIDMLLQSDRGKKVAARILDPDETLHVPHLIEIEVTQVLRRFMLAGELTEARGRDALSDLADLPFIRYPHTEFLQRVWDMRSSLSAYDAVYVALAEGLEAPLVTTDGKLSRAHGHDVQIELIEA